MHIVNFPSHSVWLGVPACFDVICVAVCEFACQVVSCQTERSLRGDSAFDRPADTLAFSPSNVCVCVCVWDKVGGGCACVHVCVCVGVRHE